MIALGTGWITWQLAKLENQRAEAERELAEQRAQDEALQAYLDQMTQLVLDRKLLEAEVGDPVYTLAQARTAAIINSLDAENNRGVALFLTDSGLTRAGESSISLLTRTDLSRADLTGAVLYSADLSYARLSDAELSDANLLLANLSNAYLGGANLSGARLSGADLSLATLPGADLSNANLSGADLRSAYLRNANLTSAEPSNANLTEAYVSEKQLLTAGSLEGATMPNGQKYENWIKSEGRSDDG